MLTTYRHSDFSIEALLAAKPGTVSVCVPARDTAELAARTVTELGGLRSAGLVDQIVVIDGSRGPGTGAAALAAGAEVHHESALLPEFGPVLGKGDAMWRGLTVCRGDHVCFVDSDLSDFGPHYITGLLGPLFTEPGCEFVKATYRRPLRVGDTEIADEGGRVTELTARPLLERFAPQAAEFRQPLAGECAARRELFERIPFCTGYGVEIAMLVDLVGELGVERLAEVDLGSRRNSHQSLGALAAMAREVVSALFARVDVGANGRAPDRPERALERPPLAEYLAATSV